MPTYQVKKVMEVEVLIEAEDDEEAYQSAGCLAIIMDAGEMPVTYYNLTYTTLQHTTELFQVEETTVEDRLNARLARLSQAIISLRRPRE